MSHSPSLTRNIIEQADILYAEEFTRRALRYDQVATGICLAGHREANNTGLGNAKRCNNFVNLSYFDCHIGELKGVCNCFGNALVMAGRELPPAVTVPKLVNDG